MKSVFQYYIDDRFLSVIIRETCFMSAIRAIWHLTHIMIYNMYRTIEIVMHAVALSIKHFFYKCIVEHEQCMRVHYCIYLFCLPCVNQGTWRQLSIVSS